MSEKETNESKVVYGSDHFKKELLKAGRDCLKTLHAILYSCDELLKIQVKKEKKTEKVAEKYE